MKKLSALFATTTAYLLLAPATLAQVNVNPCDPNAPGGSANSSQFKKSLCNIQGDNSGIIIRNVVIALLVGATIIALFFLIYGGIRWILSGGDKGKVEAARNTIVAAIIGLIVTFLAYFILNLVLSLFGLSFGNLEIPKIVPGT